MSNWFKAQQAAEYAVKGLLYGFGIMAYGHSVVNLLGRLKEKMKIPAEILRMARLLDRHYIPPRYPNAHPEGSPFEYYDAETADEEKKDYRFRQLPLPKGGACSRRDSDAI